MSICVYVYLIGGLSSDCFSCWSLCFTLLQSDMTFDQCLHNRLYMSRLIGWQVITPLCATDKAVVRLSLRRTALRFTSVCTPTRNRTSVKLMDVKSLLPLSTGRPNNVKQRVSVPCCHIDIICVMSLTMRICSSIRLPLGISLRYL